MLLSTNQRPSGSCTNSSGIKQIRIFGITLTGAGSCCLIWGIRTIRSCKSWSMCSPRPHEKVSPHSHTLISSRGSGEGAARQSCTIGPALLCRQRARGNPRNQRRINVLYTYLKYLTYKIII